MKNWQKHLFTGPSLGLSAKLVFIFTFLIGIISAFIYFYFPLKLQREGIKLISEKTHSLAATAAFNISFSLIFEDRKDIAAVFEGVKQDADVYYLIVHDREGKIFGAYNYQVALEADYLLAAAGNSITGDGSIYRIATPILHNKEKIGRLFLGMSLKSLKVLLTRSRKTTTLVSATIFGLGMLAVFIISMFITSPLKKMVRTIEEISRGDLSRRVTLSSRGEVGQLAAAFNLMVANLEAFSRKKEEFADSLENKVIERTRELQLEVNERRMAQEALEKSEEKYRSLVDNPLIGIYISQDHILKFCNRQLANIFGFQNPDEIIGMPIENLLTLESRELLSIEGENLTGSARHTTGGNELKGLRKDGSIIDIETLENPIFYLGEPAIQGILIDITNRKQAEEEKKRLEEQLYQSQKMESVGRLAGGIAHDFNNILGAIMGYAEISLDQVPAESKLAVNLQQIISASDRARDVIKQILIFSRKSDKEKEPILLAEVVKEAMNLMRSVLPTTIDIRLDLGNSLSPILADWSEMHQVIMNLCSNANYAMRDKGGVLEIILKEIELSSDEIIDHISLKPGRYQQLTVSDTGHGIPPEIRARIFEPYYTTKKVGEGSGLGLAVVQSIIEDHGGKISLYSEVSKGTSFRIFFPVVARQVATTAAKSVEPAQGGCERILLVDDEPNLVELGKLILEMVGYQVTAQTSSLEALELFHENPDQFDLIISDQTMPKMTGIQLAQKVRQIKKHIPIIVCSGFSESLNEENFKSQEIDAFLMKPVLKTNLFKTIRQVLDRTQQTH